MSNAMIFRFLIVEDEIEALRRDIRYHSLSMKHLLPPGLQLSLLCPPSCLANRVSQLNQQNNFLLDKTRNVLIAEWDDTEQEESVDISMKCEAAQSVRPQI